MSDLWHHGYGMIVKGKIGFEAIEFYSRDLKTVAVSIRDKSVTGMTKAEFNLDSLYKAIKCLKDHHDDVYAEEAKDWLDSQRGKVNTTASDIIRRTEGGYQGKNLDDLIEWEKDNAEEA